MKRSKQDKLFWIQFDQSNRDFLSNTATFMLIKNFSQRIKNGQRQSTCSISG